MQVKHMIIPYVPMLVPPKRWKGYDINLKLMEIVPIVMVGLWWGKHLGICCVELSILELVWRSGVVDQKHFRSKLDFFFVLGVSSYSKQRFGLQNTFGRNKKFVLLAEIFLAEVQSKNLSLNYSRKVKCHTTHLPISFSLIFFKSLLQSCNKTLFNFLMEVLLSTGLNLEMLVLITLHRIAPPNGHLVISHF